MVGGIVVVAAAAAVSRAGKVSESKKNGDGDG